MTSARTPLRALVATGTAAAFALAAPVAFAHDVVVGGDPADGETVEEFPDSVTLEFSAVPREGFNTFALSEADSGEVLHTGEPEIDGRFLTLDLPDDLDAGAGEYRIGFQITSSDGHATRGETTFEVAGEAEPAADNADNAEPAAAEEEDSVLAGPVGILVAIAGVLALIAVVVLAVRRGKVSRELDERTQHDDPNQH